MIANLILSIVLSETGSHLINFLYQHENLPILNHARFRKIFLIAIFFICAMILINLPIQEFFYRMSAIFFLALIICTDFEQYIIFNKILIPFAMLEIFFTKPTADNFFYAIICGGIFLLLAFLTNGVGGGDIKFISILGFIFCEKIFSVIILACILSIIFILLKQKRRTDLIPFGAFLSISAIIQICLNYIS